MWTRHAPYMEYIFPLKKMAAKNLHGRNYEPGKPLSEQFRGEIVNMFNRGFSKKQISRDLQVAPRTVRKIIRHFQSYGTVSAFSRGGSDPRKVTEDVLQCIEIWKLQQQPMLVKYKVSFSLKEFVMGLPYRLCHR